MGGEFAQRLEDLAEALDGPLAPAVSRDGGRVLFASGSMDTTAHDQASATAWAQRHFLPRYGSLFVDTSAWQLGIVPGFEPTGQDAPPALRFQQSSHGLGLEGAFVDLTFSEDWSELIALASSTASIAPPPPSRAVISAAQAIDAARTRSGALSPVDLASTPAHGWAAPTILRPTGRGGAATAGWTVLFRTPLLPDWQVLECRLDASGGTVLGVRIRSVRRSPGTPAAASAAGRMRTPPAPEVLVALDAITGSDAIAILHRAVSQQLRAVHVLAESFRDWQTPPLATATAAVATVVSRLRPRVWYLRVEASADSLLEVAGDAVVRTIRLPANDDRCEPGLVSALQHIDATVSLVAYTHPGVTTAESTRLLAAAAGGSSRVRVRDSAIEVQARGDRVDAVLAVDSLSYLDELDSLDDPVETPARASALECIEKRDHGLCGDPLAEGVAADRAWIRLALNLPETPTVAGVTVGEIDSTPPGSDPQFGDSMMVRVYPSKEYVAISDWHAHAVLGVMISAGIADPTHKLSEGFAKRLRGVCPGVDARTASAKTTGGVVAAIRALADDGTARCVNLSIALGQNGRYATVARELDRQGWANGDSLGRPVFVVAAGNAAQSRAICTVDGVTKKGSRTRLNDFATGKNTLAVGAAYCSDTFGNDATVLWARSCEGTQDGRRKPEVVAWGVKVPVLFFFSRKGYRKASGTSVAAPAITGLVSLVIGAASPLVMRPSTVRGILCHVAVGVQASTSFGIPDGQRAIEIAADRTSSRRWREVSVGLVLDGEPLGDTDIDVADVDCVTGEGPCSGILTLAWDEPPARIDRPFGTARHLWVRAVYLDSTGEFRTVETTESVNTVTRLILPEYVPGSAVRLAISFVRGMDAMGEGDGDVPSRVWLSIVGGVVAMQEGQPGMPATRSDDMIRRPGGPSHLRPAPATSEHPGAPRRPPGSTRWAP